LLEQPRGIQEHKPTVKSNGKADITKIIQMSKNISNGTYESFFDLENVPKYADESSSLKDLFSLRNTKKRPYPVVEEDSMMEEKWIPNKRKPRKSY